MQAAGQPLGAAAVDRSGQRVAAVIWADDGPAVRVLQVAADDAKAVREALLAVSAAAGGRPVRAVNFPEDGEVARAIAGFGIDPELAQFEMELPLCHGLQSVTRPRSATGESRAACASRLPTVLGAQDRR
jgi:hypothetical protein